MLSCQIYDTCKQKETLQNREHRAAVGYSGAEHPTGFRPHTGLSPLEPIKHQIRRSTPYCMFEIFYETGLLRCAFYSPMLGRSLPMTCLGSSCPLCARSNDPWAFLLFQCRHSITPWNQSWSSPARVRMGIGHFELLMTTDQPFLRAVVSFPSNEAHAVSGQSLGTSRRRVTLFARDAVRR